METLKSAAKCPSLSSHTARAAHRPSRCPTREREARAAGEPICRSLPRRLCLSVFPEGCPPPRGPWTSSPPPRRCWATRTRRTSPPRSVCTRLRRARNWKTSASSPRTPSPPSCRGQMCGWTRGTTMTRCPGGEDGLRRAPSSSSTADRGSPGPRSSWSTGTTAPPSTWTPSSTPTHGNRESKPFLIHPSLCLT